VHGHSGGGARILGSNTRLREKKKGGALQKKGSLRNRASGGNPQGLRVPWESSKGAWGQNRVLLGNLFADAGDDDLDGLPPMGDGGDDRKAENYPHQAQGGGFGDNYSNPPSFLRTRMPVKKTRQCERFIRQLGKRAGPGLEKKKGRTPVRKMNVRHYLCEEEVHGRNLSKSSKN